MSPFGLSTYRGRHRVPRRRPSAVASALAVVAAAGTLVALPQLAGTSNAVVPPAVTDVNPNAVPTALFGGRVERLAIDPLNTLKMFAASELGGLWRTDDGGASWNHVDAVPMAVVQDVKIAASDPSLVIAVGNYEGSQTSQGGVWRSTDGGATWAKSAGSDPPAACTTESNALTVAIGAGTPGSLPVFVGDSCGLTRSNSSAADNTWTRLDPDGAFDNGLGQTHQIEDVEVRPGGGGQLQVDVCGQQGFFRSNDSGGTWSAADANSPTFRNATSPGIQGGAFGVCNVDVAPSDPNTVYLSNFEGGTASGFCAGQLLESTDGGATWTQMGSDVTDSNCRDPFVQVQDNPDGDATTYHVYFGTSVRVLRQTCDTDNAPSCATGAANWPRWDSNTPHTDPTSIAFDPALPTGCPLFLSGDGGVFRMTSSGCGATPTITHANTGLHAYDSSQMTGTVWPTHTDLYFGTQDNGTFYTADGGATYINNGPDTYNLIADRQGNPNASVLRRDCFGCGVFRQPPGGVGNIAFNPPPAPWNSDFGNTFAGTQWAPLSYAVIARDAPPDDGVAPPEPAPNWAVFYTVDAGANWTKLGANLPAGPPGAGSGPGSHGQIKASGPAASPIFYLSLGGALYRLNGGTLDPSQATNTATLTQVSTGITNVRQWDVDPVDPSRLYAVSQNGSQSLMRSINGGASWVADPEITSLVTGNGAYKWSSSVGPMATAIGFDPYSDTILVGTRYNGIFASVNNGDTWISVPGSKTITLALDFLFDDVRQTAFVGSRGRGLWRIDLPESDLRITKTDSPDPVIAGEQLKYTITVTNDGPDTAGSITVVDDLPPQLEFVTSSIPCAEETVSGHDRVTCNVPDLDSGDSFTFTLTTFVNTDAVSDNGEPLTIVNTATVSSGVTVDRDPSDNTATATTVVNDSADLELTKICDPAELRAGQTAHCTIFVDNHGPSDARGVVLTDTLLSDGTFTVSNVAVADGAGSCAAPVAVAGGKRFTCNLQVIQAESTTAAGRRTVSYDVTANDAQEIDNKARAQSDTPDPDDTNNIKDTTIVVSAVSDLSITKTAPATAVAGTEFDYQLGISNGGPSAAENVRIEDDVPAGVTILSVTGSGGATCVAGVPGNPLQPTTCSYGTLASGASRTMTVHVRVNPGTVGVLHNDARVTSDTFDPDSADNLAHTDTDVLTRADLSVTKSDSPDPVVAGTPIAYTIRVSNAGPSVARDVAIVDALPGFVQFGSATIQHGSGACALVVGNPNEVRCQLGDLNAGDYVDVVIAGTVKSAAPSGVVLVNNVTVTSTTQDDVPGNNTAQTSTTVATRADLRLSHTSDALVYKPSSTIHYTITVVNDGPSDAVNVVITDLLPPAKFGYYLSDDGGCTLAGQTLTCPGVTLPAGASRIVLVKFFVQGSKGTIQATASVTSDTPDPNTANNAQTRTVTRK